MLLVPAPLPETSTVSTLVKTLNHNSCLLTCLCILLLLLPLVFKSCFCCCLHLHVIVVICAVAVFLFVLFLFYFLVYHCVVAVHNCFYRCFWCWFHFFLLELSPFILCRLCLFPLILMFIHLSTIFRNRTVNVDYRVLPKLLL